MNGNWMNCSVTVFIAAIGLVGCDSSDPPPPPATSQTQAAPLAQTPTSPSAQMVATPTMSADTPNEIKPSDVVPVATPAAPPTESAPVSTASAPAQDLKVATFSGLTAPKPATWMPRPITRERASMVAAEYSVPGRDGFDMARLIIYHNIGGTPEDNILRWKQSQFRTADLKAVEPTISNFDVGEMSVTFAEFAGEFKGTGSVNFSPDHTLLAAIIPNATPGQIILYFVGPTGTVEPNRKAFMELIRNLKRVEAEK